jgi:hypothetical protein
MNDCIFSQSMIDIQLYIFVFAIKADCFLFFLFFLFFFA